MDIKIRYTDKACNKVKVTYKRNEIIRFLHILHDNSKAGNKHGLYDIEENTRNVSLIFEFKNEIKNFESIVDYINALYNEHLALENKFFRRNKLEEIMEG